MENTDPQSEIDFFYCCVFETRQTTSKARRRVYNYSKTGLEMDTPRAVKGPQTRLPERSRDGHLRGRMAD